MLNINKSSLLARGLNDKWSLRITEVSEGISNKYVKPHYSLLKMEPYAP